MICAYGKSSSQIRLERVLLNDFLIFRKEVPIFIKPSAPLHSLSKESATTGQRKLLSIKPNCSICAYSTY